MPIFYWIQGNDSTQDEKAASAIHAMRLDNEVAGKAVQVRLTQGNEPRHFIKMFKGKMIIFTGGHASGFRNIHDYDSYDVDGTRLFHVSLTSNIVHIELFYPRLLINRFGVMELMICALYR